MNPEKRKINILVVDDEPANIKVLMPVFMERGYEVRTALNGRLALASAAKRIPDLVLLDVRMPDMDGFEVCRQLKADERLRQVPVLFISALGETHDIVKGLKSGGVDYITKPFRFEEVLARVETHLSIQTLQKQLKREIEERKRAQQDLLDLNTQLEQRVAERTANLQARTMELLAAKEAAEAASIAKSKFLSNMSHELMTPLNPIMGYAQILITEKNMTPEQKELLQVVCDSCEHLKTLICDILELVNIDTCRETVEFVSFNLSELIAEVVQNIQTKARQKNLVFNYEEIEGIPASVFGDSGKLRQVLFHLLDNAVKFTDFGSVTLRASVVQSPRSANGEMTSMEKWRLRFDVLDTGVGLVAAIAEKIFEPFYQGEIEGRLIEGAGLGLTLSHKLVKLMGGRLSFQSPATKEAGCKGGPGSIFTVELDLGAEKREAAAASTP